MKMSIFYKFFCIIFISFSFVEFLSLHIDYEKSLNYRLGILKNEVNTYDSETFATYMKSQELSEAEFIQAFVNHFKDKEMYSVHLLMKDDLLDSQHQVLVTQYEVPAGFAKMTLLNLKTHKEEHYTVSHQCDDQIEERLNAFDELTLSDLKLEENQIVEINGFEKEYRVLRYESSNIYYELNHKGQMTYIKHKEYRNEILSFVQSLQNIEDNEIVFYTPQYKGGVIVYSKVYVASGFELEDKHIIQNHPINEELERVQDYYVVSAYYMDGLQMVDKINQEVRTSKSDVFFSIMFVSFLISLFLSWMLTRHIKEISDATKQIASNNFDLQLREYSKDELGTLSKNINRMSEKLKQTMDELNQEIQHVKSLEGMRKEFIANFTHEIKTPLSIINGYIELMGKSNEEDKKMEYLQAIQKETGRINELVMDMLEITRLESKKVILHLEKLDLEEMTSDLLEEFLPLFSQKHIKVRVDISDEPVLVSKKEIDKVIRNLISNAILHTPPFGRIKITFKEFYYRVENEGDPLRDEALASVFETYVSSRKEGTGLGLAICKAIFELHHFDYGVENTSQGVCFWFKVK